MRKAAAVEAALGAAPWAPPRKPRRLRIAPDLSTKNPAWFPTRARIMSFNFLNRLNRGASSSLIVPLEPADRKPAARSSNLPWRASSEYAIGAECRRFCVWNYGDRSSRNIEIGKMSPQFQLCAQSPRPSHLDRSRPASHDRVLIRPTKQPPYCPDARPSGNVHQRTRRSRRCRKIGGCLLERNWQMAQPRSAPCVRVSSWHYR